MESEKKAAPSFHSTPPSAPPPSNGASNAFSRVRPMHGRTTGPTRRSSKGQWTPEEDDILCKAVQRYQGKNWKKIAEYFRDRTDVQCLHRWQKVLNPELVKGPWSKEEDEIIIQLVDKYGAKKWSTIAQHLPGRIGKQCRERWHNHLNPGINKEAWTQEEEIVLIRAHQVNGNRWAELTKYLPGRSDNAIKNHWNSSVKKKLDSYVASGLLAEFEALPAVSHQNHQSVPTASLQMHHNSEDGSICKDGVETEDNSECSQVGGSQSVSDISNTACQTREDSFFAQELDCGNMQTTSPVASGSVQYCPSLDDITFTFSDLPYEFNCPSTYLEDNVSKDRQSYTDGDSRFGSISLPDVSCMELAAEPSDLSRNCLLTEHKTENGMSQDTFQSKGDDIVDMDRYRESLQSGFQGTGETLALQSYNPLDSECQNPSSISLDDQAGNNLAICTKEHQETDSLCIYQALEVAKNAEQGSSSASPCCGKVSVDLTKQTDEMEPFASENEARTLCYEPPLFPSFDIPFFSCDLAQSGSDAPHEYSPLGIRQFMTSSMESLTPFKLWDSPTSDDCPNAVLKNAAKSFAITPSILKKRHRDLLSPLSPFSERRYDKKTGSDVNQGFLCTSRLTHEFSRLDVMFDEADPDHGKQLPSPSNDQIDTETLIEGKENICPNSQGQTGETKYNCDSRDNTSKEEWSKNPTLDMVKEGNFGDDNTPRGVLVERPLNDRDVSSQGGAGPNAVLKPIDQGSKITPNKGAISEQGTDKAGCVLSSCSLGLQKKTTVSLSGQSVSGVSTEMIDSLVNEVGAENLNIFGGTPFRRSIESPSSWKSPWYFSSLVALPRVDTDITIEDIGIFMSPGMRSVDALGLMKQINYQNANAYEDAREFLGSETPESILRKRSIENEKHETESNNDVESHQEGRLRSSSDLLTERRILDFSESGAT